MGDLFVHYSVLREFIDVEGFHTVPDIGVRQK